MHNCQLGGCPVTATMRLTIKRKGSFAAYLDLCDGCLRKTTAGAKEGSYTVCSLKFIEECRIKKLSEKK